MISINAFNPDMDISNHLLSNKRTLPQDVAPLCPARICVCFDILPGRQQTYSAVCGTGSTDAAEDHLLMKPETARCTTLKNTTKRKLIVLLAMEPQTRSNILPIYCKLLIIGC